MVQTKRVDVRQDGPLDGVTNMVRDTALFEAAERGEPGGRVYSWDGPWISLGRQQDASRDLVDPNFVPWVMRPTGGKAVLHGHDVTVGLSLPLSFISRHDSDGPHPLSRSVRTVYRFICGPLVTALRDCGLNVGLAEGTPHCGTGPRTADCFAHVSPNDIVHMTTGRKACGCALRLTARAVLVQASIPNGPPLLDPKRIFGEISSENIQSWDSGAFASYLAKALN